MVYHATSANSSRASPAPMSRKSLLFVVPVISNVTAYTIFPEGSRSMSAAQGR